MVRAHPSIRNEDVERCFVFHEWIRTRLDGLAIAADREVRIPVTCYGLALDHLLGVAVLLRDGIYASAFALARPSYEAYVRGAWLHCCAAPADFDAYEADKPGPSFYAMTSALEANPNFAGGSLSRVLKEAVPTLHSFAHSGFNQVARNWSLEALESNYSIDDVTALARFATANALLAFQLIAIEAKRMDLAEETLAVMKNWSAAQA